MRVWIFRRSLQCLNGLWTYLEVLLQGKQKGKINLFLCISTTHVRNLTSITRARPTFGSRVSSSAPYALCCDLSLVSFCSCCSLTLASFSAAFFSAFMRLFSSLRTQKQNVTRSALKHNLHMDAVEVFSECNNQWQKVGRFSHEMETPPTFCHFSIDFLVQAKAGFESRAEQTSAPWMSAARTLWPESTWCECPIWWIEKKYGSDLMHPYKRWYHGTRPSDHGTVHLPHLYTMVYT